MILAASHTDPCDTAELSEDDAREVGRFAAFLCAAAVSWQHEAFELVYGDEVPKPRGDA